MKLLTLLLDTNGEFESRVDYFTNRIMETINDNKIDDTITSKPLTDITLGP